MDPHIATSSPRSTGLSEAFIHDCPLPGLGPEQYLELLSAAIDTCWEEGMGFAEIVSGSGAPTDEPQAAYETIFQFFSWEFVDFLFLQALGVLGDRLLNREPRGWAADCGAIATGQHFFGGQKHLFHSLLMPMMFRALCLYQPVVQLLHQTLGDRCDHALLLSIGTDAIVVSLPRIYAALTTDPADPWASFTGDAAC